MIGHRYLIVDGMLSGTGIRDPINGGYLEPSEIGLPDRLQSRLASWLSSYEDAHFGGYNDPARNEALDREGIEIAKMIRAELPGAKVRYFSNANMREIRF